METKIKEVEKEENGMPWGMILLIAAGYLVYRKYFKVQLSGVPVNLGQIGPRVYTSIQERNILATIRRRKL